RQAHARRGGPAVRACGQRMRADGHPVLSLSVQALRFCPHRLFPRFLQTKERAGEMAAVPSLSRSSF
ncbi:hypothetical protein GGH92_009000, partial [Coemansia sp. RSA 2673]